MGDFDTNEEAIYNIGAVSRMTGVTETTLRVWERRYSFPQASRTDGGHRLYSQHEVTRLQWVKARIDEGLQISQAIKALHQFEQENPVEDTHFNLYITPPKQAPVPGAFAERLFDALVEHNPILSERIMAEAITVYPLEHVILHTICPIMDEIGSAWERGEIDIATEHFATNFLRHHLLQWMRIGPPPYDVSPIILACAPGELHEGSLLMFAVMLRRLRWPVSYLGQTIALHDFVTFTEKLQPSAIVFVAMTEQSAQALVEWPRWLPGVYETQQPVVCFGGRIFSVQPAMIDQVPGIFLGKSLEDGLTLLNKLLSELHSQVR